MRIRRLTLHGFKSFPARTTLAFGEGISGIVGPNGCGKSNVVDALRWVLGETNVRSLRGAEGSDVVFGGSSAVAPSTSAEVRLMFSNEGGEPFPGVHAGLTELELCRRMHRDGGSDYEINGARVRRKDVAELVRDAGIGSAHAFVEQGRVDRLVHASPVERRAMIDDLAGVSAWRARRDEALGRLAATAAQLDRAADLAEELRRQRMRGQAAAVAACRWKRLRARLRLVEIAVSLVRYDERTRDRRVLRERVRDGADRAMTAARERDRRAADVARRAEELASVEMLADAARDASHAADLAAREAEVRRQAAEAAVVVAYERRAEAETAAARRSAGEARAAHDRACTEAALAQEASAVAQAALTDAAERLAAVEALARARELASSTASSAAHAARTVAQEAHAERARWEARRTEREQLGSVASSHAAALRLAHAFRAREEAAAAESEAAARRGAADMAVVEAVAAVTSARSALDGAEADRESADVRRVEAHEAFLAAAAAAEAQWAEELAIVRATSAARETACRRNVEENEAKLRTDAVAAAQAALVEAERLRTVARDSLSQARERAESLRDRALRLAAERDAMRPVEGDVDAVATRLARPVHRLAEELDPSDPRREALDPWLDLPVVPSAEVDDWLAELRSGETIALVPHERIAAWLAGASARGHGAWTDPAGVVRRGSGALARWNRRLAAEGALAEVAPLLAEARAAEARAMQVVADAERAHGEASGAVAAAWALQPEDPAARRAWQAAQREGQEAEHDVLARAAAARASVVAPSPGPVPAVDRSAWQAAVDALAVARTIAADADRAHGRALTALALASQARADAERAAQEVAEAATAGAAAAQQLDAADAAARAAEARAGEREHLAAEASRAASDAVAWVRSAAEAHAAAVATATAAAAEVTGAEGRAQTAASFLHAALVADEAADERRDAAVDAHAGAVRVADACVASAASRASVRDAAAAADLAARAQVVRVRAALAEAEKLALQARQHADQALAEASRDEVDLATAMQEIEALRAAMGDRYQVSLAALLDRLDRGPVVLDPDPQALVAVDVGDVRIDGVSPLVLRSLADREQVAAWVDAVRETRAALDALGDVNLGAAEAYEELAARHDDLEAQRADLDRSVADLRSAIARLNRECRESFREAFDAIDAGLREVYPRLLGGGAARLVLDDTDDVLDAGVALWVQPPGKRLQHLGLLSGGEKAMAAIALLIAMFRFRPSSFCVLDEVDAPLDEANGSRFTAILREMAGQTQVLVVTHHRQTMEVADTLYGVSMAPPGVSRVVSVRLAGAALDVAGG